MATGCGEEAGLPVKTAGSSESRSAFPKRQVVWPLSCVGEASGLQTVRAERHSLCLLNSPLKGARRMR